jgi:hypothetical protein
MGRILVFVAGVAAGVIGTLVVEKPKDVAERLRAAAAALRNKLREVFQPGPQEGEGPVQGNEGVS